MTVIVSLPLIDRPECGLLIWTTTPWTLPSNLAVTVNPDLVYVEILDKESSKKYIIAEALLCTLYKDVSKDSGLFQILCSFKGAEMKGWEYVQPFPVFEPRRQTHGNFVVLCDSYVTADAGTGLVHCAPAFGEDDHRVALANGIILENEAIPMTIDEKGHFLMNVLDNCPLLSSSSVPGSYFKDADKEIIKALKVSNRLVQSVQHKHSYPFCWRSDTPLIFKAVPSWFIRVTDSIPQLLNNQEKTRWVPPGVGEKKFTHWLAAAHDWAISRNRYWGTPIPVWSSPDGKELVVIGSIEELSRLSGKSVESIVDLHRENIDSIEIPSQIDPTTRPPLRRIEEVFDCWFESGSVPYASQHYPFSEEGNNAEQPKGTFNSSFPADFIAEGIDQTRGWFYTLSVLSTLLFDKPPFRNVIVNGLILAGDGKKMSKRLKNYPEPGLILSQYGADALRLYLINSPVVRAEFLCFKEEGVRGILRDVLIPWTNTVRFFTELASLLNIKYNRPFMGDFTTCQDESNSHVQLNYSEDILDRWILSLLQTLVKEVRFEMDSYRLYAVVPKLLTFLSSLSGWYLRLSRRRCKNSEAPEAQYKALETLFHVIYILSIIMAPFTPFLAESLYQELCKFISNDGNQNSLSMDDVLSVHFQPFPSVQTQLVDVQTEKAFSLFQEAMDQARAIREQKNISLKIPLSSMIIIVDSKEKQALLNPLICYMSEDLNVRDVLILTDDEVESYGISVSYQAIPNFSLLGKRLKSELGALQKALKEDVTDARLKSFFSNTSEGLVVGKWLLNEEEVSIIRSLTKISPGFDQQQNCSNNREVITLLYTELSDELIQEGAAREVVSHVQQLRKKAGLKQSDLASIYYEDSGCSLFNTQAEYLGRSLKNTPLLPKKNNDMASSDKNSFIYNDEFTISESLIRLTLVTEKN